MSKSKRLSSAALVSGLLLTLIPASIGPAGAETQGRRDRVYSLRHRKGPDLIRFDYAVKHVPWKSSKPIASLTDDPKASGRAQAITGEAKLPVALVEFPDDGADELNHPPSTFNDMMFKPDYTIGGGSVRDYYNEISHGLFDVTGQVSSSWLMMPEDVDFYAGNDNGLQATEPNGRTLAVDAAKAADPTFDFCDYDSDADGYVDVFFVVHAGPGAEEYNPGETPRGIWSHQSAVDFATQDTCADGKRVRIGNYTVQPEEHRFTELVAPGAPANMITIGVFCHEFGHALGLPDLYDIDYDTNGGVGTWDLMAGGGYGIDGFTPSRPAPFGAWTAAELGWSLPQVVEEDLTGMSFSSADKHPDGTSFTGALRLAPGGDLSSPEYFLVEYRTSETGWSQGVPQGLLVWHVNTSRRTNTNEDNMDADDRLLEVVQADGLDDLGGTYGVQDGLADAGDTFPGSTSRTFLDGNGNPNSDLRDGSSSHIAIRNALVSGTSLTADVTVFDQLVQPEAPTGLGASVNGSKVNLSWTPSVSTDVTEHRIYRSTEPLGAPVRVGSVLSGSSFTDSSGEPGATYYYTVRAFNGAESASSDQVTVSLGFFDLAPTSMKAYIGRKSGKVSSLASKGGGVVTFKSKSYQGVQALDYEFSFFLNPENLPPDLGVEVVSDNKMKAAIYVANWGDEVYEFAGILRFRPGRQKSVDLGTVSDYVTDFGEVRVALVWNQATAFKHVIDRVALALQ